MRSAPSQNANQRSAVCVPRPPKTQTSEAPFASRLSSKRKPAKRRLRPASPQNANQRSAVCVPRPPKTQTSEAPFASRVSSKRKPTERLRFEKEEQRSGAEKWPLIRRWAAVLKRSGFRSDVVPPTGLEPVRNFFRQILSLLCLPFQHGGVDKSEFILPSFPKRVKSWRGSFCD